MKPIRQTALWHLHRRSNAEMMEYRGWSLPAKFHAQEKEKVLQGAGLADWSCLVKLDLKGAATTTAPAIADSARCWHLGRGHYLVTAEPGDQDAVEAAVRSCEDLYCTDVTSVMTDLVLAGPHSRRILGKLTSAGLADSALPNGTCVQSSVAHVRAIVLRQDIGALPAFHLLAGRDYGESLWEALLHAGHEFSLTAFGVETYLSLHSEAGK